MLIGGDVVHAQRRQIINRRAQANRAFNVRRPGLKLVGNLGKRRFFKRDRRDHVAPTLPGRHGFQKRPLAVQNADAGGAIELMS